MTEAEIANFETLQTVFDNTHEALVRTRLTETIEAGTEIAVVAAFVSDADGSGVMTPFAIMVPGNPYEMLADPLEEE